MKRQNCNGNARIDRTHHSSIHVWHRPSERKGNFPSLATQVRLPRSTHSCCYFRYNLPHTAAGRVCKPSPKSTTHVPTALLGSLGVCRRVLTSTGRSQRSANEHGGNKNTRWRFCSRTDLRWGVRKRVLVFWLAPTALPDPPTKTSQP